MLSFWMYKNECLNIYAILRLCVLYHVLFLAIIAPWINLIDYSTATAILPLRKACILIDVDIPNCQTCCVLWCLLHISFIRQWASCLKLGFEILSSSTHLHSCLSQQLIIWGVEWRWWWWWYEAIIVLCMHVVTTCPYDLFFIICFIFIPLLVTLNETATSRDDSRARFSLWIYYLCFGFLQTA